MKDVFAWHPRARLVFAAAEAEADLRRAMSGAPFRIGGHGALEAGAGQFETLTSGSTAAPRRILRSMESWTRSFAQNATLFGIGAGVRVAVLGRLEQSLALYGAIEALHLGADLVALGGAGPRAQARALAGVEVLYATPAQVRLLCEAGCGPLPDLRQIILGGAKLDARLRADLGAITTAALSEFYGAAEASFITLAGAGAPEASVGAPYPDVEITVRDGEIWVRSPYLFTRYAGGEGGSARWQDGWLSVGEMGRLEGGYLYLSGRAGRMVTVADQNVFPEEIEAYLAGCAGIMRAAVVPRRDDLRGVHLVAFVQGDAHAEPEIRAGLRAVFGPLKAPKAMQWRAEWPMLPSGKTDLAALQAEVDAWL